MTLLDGSAAPRFATLRPAPQRFAPLRNATLCFFWWFSAAAQRSAAHRAAAPRTATLTLPSET